MRRCMFSLVCVSVFPSLAMAAEVKFSAQPAAVKADGGVKITFAVSAPTDVEVTVLDAKGRAVRHVAAGVLGGKNPPPAPLKAGLAQELTWDGMDDAGNEAVGGPFAVRVRAGMSAAFGRVIGGSPYTGAVTTGAPSDSLAVDKDGTLYVKMGSFVPQLHAAMPWQIRKFDRTGTYQKTVLPWAPSTPRDKTPGFRLIETGDDFLTPANHTPLDPVLFNFGDNIYQRIVDGCLVFVDNGGAMLHFIKMDGSNALRSVPMRSNPNKLKWAKWLSPQVAFSPDGKCAYYSNVANTPYDGQKPSDIDPNFPQGRVYRHDLAKEGADPVPFYDLELPDWETTKYWMPSAWDKKTAAAGIDVDEKGNAFVCDLVNQEVVELSPDGKKVSATKVPWPDKVIAGKNGVLYVVSRKVSRGYPPPATLYKVAGRGADAKVAAELAFTSRGAGQTIALDDSGDVPVLWLGGGGELLRLEDRGDEFAVTNQNVLNCDKDAVGYVCYLDVDGEADLVYVTQGMGPVWRYDGRTGEGGPLAIKACDLAIGPGGMIYTWGTTGSYGGPIARYDRDAKPAPVASGKNTYGGLTGRYGRGNSVCGLDVDWRGRVFAVNGGNECQVLVFDADGKPVTFEREGGSVPAAVTGVSGRGGSIRLDARGNIYIFQEGLPKDFTPPKGFGKDAGYLRSTGTIHKFGPGGGSFAGKARTPVGVLATYPGCGPFSGAWASTMSVCVCQKPRFDVDAAGRLYIPNAITFTVAVVDNAGNEIVAFGGYGNFDAQGPKSAEPKPAIPLGWPTAVGASDDHIYVGDMLNHRVVRVDKQFAAEATCDVK